MNNTPKPKPASILGADGKPAASKAPVGEKRKGLQMTIPLDVPSMGMYAQGLFIVSIPMNKCDSKLAKMVLADAFGSVLLTYYEAEKLKKAHEGGLAKRGVAMAKGAIDRALGRARPEGSA